MTRPVDNTHRGSTTHLLKEPIFPGYLPGKNVVCIFSQVKSKVSLSVPGIRISQHRGRPHLHGLPFRRLGGAVGQSLTLTAEAKECWLCAE